MLTLYMFEISVIIILLTYYFVFCLRFFVESVDFVS